MVNSASNYPPLSWTSGTVTAADGQTYEMSSASSRQQMMDNGLVYFIAQVGGAIKAASVLQNWQTESCTYSFKGWLLFTWDTTAAEFLPVGEAQTDWWATAGDGSINAALAPSGRPNPCQ